eukprot:3854-Heterococcus_DN1.PRE.1
MNITVKIYHVRRKYGGITEPGARSALLTHAHRCNTSLDTMLAAYNNTSEVELDMDSTEGGASTTSELCQFPLGTKVAKKFDDEWYEGAVRRYDTDDDLYWVLYIDGDSEDMDFDEVQQAVQDYKQQLQSSELVMSDTSTESAAESPPAVLPLARAGVSDTSTENAPVVIPALLPLAHAAPSSVVTEATVVVNSVATSYLLPPEMTAALQALTTAAERLATIADAAQSKAMTTTQQQQQEAMQQQQCMRMWQQQQYMCSMQQQQYMCSMQQQHRNIMWRQQLMLQQQRPYILQQQWPQQQQQQQQQLWRRPFI